jgi:hypothetical protein
VIATFLGGMVIALMYYPSSYSVPRRAEIAILPEAQRARIHDLMREMLLAIFAVVQVIMLSLIGIIIAAARATTIPLPAYLLLAFVVAPLLVTFVYLSRISRAVDDAKHEMGR